MAFPRVVDALLEGRSFTLYGDGEQSRSFTYVGDVVAASMLAMEKAGSGSTYNVGGGQEATMNETIAKLETIAGRRLDVQRGEAIAGDQRRTKADTTRITADLGWQPSTVLEQGLRAQWEWAAVESPA